MQTEMMKPSRPDGVNVLAVLSILLATFLVTGGVVELIWPNPALPGTSTGGVSGAFLIGVDVFALTFGLFWITTDSATIGIVVLILAVAYIFVGAGFLTRRNWSRLLGIAVTALPIILGIGQMALNPLNLRAAALNTV